MPASWVCISHVLFCDTGRLLTVMLDVLIHYHRRASMQDVIGNELAFWIVGERSNRICRAVVCSL